MIIHDYSFIKTLSPTLSEIINSLLSSPFVPLCPTKITQETPKTDLHQSVCCPSSFQRKQDGSPLAAFPFIPLSPLARLHPRFIC